MGRGTTRAEGGEDVAGSLDEAGWKTKQQRGEQKGAPGMREGCLSQRVTAARGTIRKTTKAGGNNDGSTGRPHAISTGPPELSNYLSASELMKLIIKFHKPVGRGRRALGGLKSGGMV
jgi:hypothetical protein